MSNIVTYQSLQTDSLLSVSVDFSVLKQNFNTINDFIKSFSQFQKKFLDLEKSQKALNENFSQYKLTSEGQFTTINEVLQSRSQISQGKSSAANQQLNEIKKSIKQLKSFITQSTRQQHEAQQIRQKQQSDINKKLQQNIKVLQQQNNQRISTIEHLSKNLTQLQSTSAKKSQISQVHFQIQIQQQKLTEINQNISNVETILKNTKVQEFKSIIDEIDQRTLNEINEMKYKFNSKATVTDLLKLEQMILNVTQFGFQNVSKIMANKVQTKKALVFLQKRVNSLIVMMLGDDQNQRQALITAKQLKCISCSKDLGDLEGKLDKNKNWSIFPVKQSNLKQKYAGFGAGFQSIIQTTVAKKGGQLKYDEKGRLIQPFNLTGTIQGSLLRTNKSQHKIQHSDSKSKLNVSPTKNSLKYETSFMYQFGKQSEKSDINITEEYYSRFRGLESFVIANGKTYPRQIPTKNQ